MKVVKHKIHFDLEQVTAAEVPFLNAFYLEGEELNKDIQDLLAFPVANQDAMPFYTLRQNSIDDIALHFEAYYEMMQYALRVAFADEKLLYKFFDCEFLRKHGKQFVPYAKATFQKNHPALYGRYDACFDPESEKLKGIYEFNGDTPVMLFESVNLQARLSEQLGTEQWNDYWQIFIETMSRHDYKNVAVACSTAYVEDMATCETLAQAFREANPHCVVQFLDLAELDFDHANIKKPFVAKGDDVPLDAVYVLSPWEEMIDTFPEMLGNWERWIDNVHLYEPAWRWFFAHKGMTALMYELMQLDSNFRETFPYYGRAVLLPTYLESETKRYPRILHEKLVEKPVVGRLSNNIRIWEHAEVASDTGGYYTGENTVFQQYCAPRKVEGRNNFILGMWMCGGVAASLCAREFDSEVLSISNERWIPHIIQMEE